MTIDPGQMAVEFLLAVRSDDHQAATQAAAQLDRLTEADVVTGLIGDQAKVAFWVDLYNAAVQQQAADAVRTQRGRFWLFRRPVITVAGHALSLDAIEHGILRRSRWKLGFGYLGNALPSRFERSQRLERIDPRIHFALNCGAASCPPIAAYEAGQVTDQLDRATRAFLGSEVVREDQVLRLPTVMLWFIGDFGGPRGLRRFLADHGIDTRGLRLRFQRFDWSPAPGRWTDDG